MVLLRSLARPLGGAGCFDDVAAGLWRAGVFPVLHAHALTGIANSVAARPRVLSNVGSRRFLRQRKHAIRDGATAQGVCTGVAIGLRSALGAFFGGYLYDSVGAVMVFRVGGLCALVGLVIFVVANLGWDCILRRNPVYPVQLDE